MSDRRALPPMLLVGYLVGEFASPERHWPLYGMAVAGAVWLGWVLIAAALQAAAETRRARR